MSKQDRQPARNITGLEYKYGLGNTIEALRGLSETSIKIQEQEKMLEAELSLRIRYDENNQIVSMLNAAADIIRLKSNRLSIESTYFTLSTNGTIKATAGIIGGCSIVNGVLQVPVANITGKLTADNIDTGIFTAKVEQLEGRLDGYDGNFESLNSRITQTETSLSVLPGQIAAKVSQTDFDALGRRVGSTESSLAVLPGQIAAKVSQTDFNALGSRVASAETSITVLSGQISAQVSREEFDTLGNRVSTAESSLTLLPGQIASKVSQTDFDDLGNRVGTAESSIIQLADKIESIIIDSDFDVFANRLTTAESRITQLSDQITLKVSQNEFDALGTRVGKAESSLSLLPDQIASKVSQSDFNELGERVGGAESSITQLSNQIALRVLQTDFDDLGNRVGTAESSITQLSNQIALKVSQTDFDDLGNTVNSISGELALKIGKNDSGQIVSMLNASADQINIESDSMKIKCSGFSLKNGRLEVTSGKIGGWGIGFNGEFQTYIMKSTDSQYLTVTWNENNIQKTVTGNVYTCLTNNGIWYLVEGYDVSVDEWKTLAKVSSLWSPTFYKSSSGGGTV